MSRRLPNQRHLPCATDNNPYQPTVQQQFQPPNGYYQQKQQQPKPEACRNGRFQPSTTIDIGLSDESTDTQSYYGYYDDSTFPHSPLKESRNTDCTFSDESGSTRLPYYEFDDESNKRYSRNAFSDRSGRRSKHMPRQQQDKFNAAPHVGNRKVYPNQEPLWDRLYQEIPSPTDMQPARRMPPPSRLSGNSMSSGMTSAIVYGCGGKCQTFENVCYFFLQLVFTMGILIGVSLCIAGVVLRKSAARNLQVLVYIGVLLALVCALLLGIQCNARSTAKRRKNAIQNAKRTAIQMETLPTTRINPMIQQQPLMMANETNRPVQVHKSLQRPHGVVVVDEQGIPWWRRKDIVNPR